MKNTFFSMLCLFFVSAFFSSSFAKIEGFYCDIFQDAGTRISGRNMKIDCDYIGYSMEYLKLGDKEIEFQNSIMIKSENDDNGYLLYPDGSPRYAIIYYHGGWMQHAENLGDEGRKLVRTHYFNGGSQFGSCAGSYMLANNPKWFNLWPGKMNGKNASKTPTDKIINAGSPLIGRCEFKEGDEIKSVMHNNGGSVDTTKMPKGTTIGAMHNSGKLKGYADSWSWKHHDSTGRICGITGHPEGNKAKDQIRYMAAIMLYITDGLGKPRIKATLKNSQLITMDKSWQDKSPSNAKIGDKQYHHFLLDCKNATDLQVDVTGQEGFDFHVFVAKDTLAFKNSSKFADSTTGGTKSLKIPKLENGKWYIGVKLATTVTTTSNSKFPTYTGKLEVLNGIAYTIKASWKGTGILANAISIKNNFPVVKNNKLILIDVGSATIKSLKIYDFKGRLCFEPQVAKNIRVYKWQPSVSGAYIIRLASNTEVVNKTLTIAK